MHRVKVSNAEKANAARRLSNIPFWGRIKSLFIADREPWMALGLTEEEYLETWSVK